MLLLFSVRVFTFSSPSVRAFFIFCKRNGSGRLSLTTPEQANPYYESNNLQVIRNKRGLSQQEIADYLGVERRTYRSWESGEATVKDTHIPKLAEVLQVEISELFRDRTKEIVINQHNTDNKDDSINGVVILLTDKDAVDHLMKFIKKKAENQ